MDALTTAHPTVPILQHTGMRGGARYCFISSGLGIGRRHAGDLLSGPK